MGWVNGLEQKKNEEKDLEEMECREKWREYVISLLLDQREIE